MVREDPGAVKAFIPSVPGDTVCLLEASALIWDKLGLLPPSLLMLEDPERPLLGRAALPIAFGMHMGELFSLGLLCLASSSMVSLTGPMNMTSEKRAMFRFPHMPRIGPRAPCN